MDIEERKQMSLFEKILGVMDDVQYLRKDGEVSTGKNSKGYKAITEEKVTTAVRASMLKYGIIIVPVEQEYDRTDTVIKDSYGNEKINRLATVATKYRIQNVDDKKDYLIAVSNGEGADTQDKGVGKAMTYAYKYLLLRTFGIPTGEDPDKVASDVFTDELRGESDNIISKRTAETLREYLKISGKEIDDICKYFKVDTLEDMTERQYALCIKIVEKGKEQNVERDL